VIDIDTRKNLLCQRSVDGLQPLNSTYLRLYQLGWVKELGQTTLLTRRCSITFGIESFWEFVECNVTQLTVVTRSLALLTNLTGEQSMMVSTRPIDRMRIARYINFHYILSSFVLLGRQAVKQVNLNKLI
jgi:hypothetical protein